MAQLTKRFIGDNQVADEKVRLDNNAFLRSRNNANSADIDIIKVNTSDQIQTGGDVVPQADNTYDIGSSSLNHVSVHTKNIESSTSINIQPAGGNITLQSASGVDVLDPTATAAQAVRFFNAAGTFYAGIKAPALAADYTLTLPVDDGASGEVLSTNGSGVLSWVASGGSGAAAPALVVLAIGADTTLAAPGTDTWDGVTALTGDLILLFGQAAPEENGVYVFDTDATPLVRAPEWNTAGEFTVGRQVVVNGVANTGDAFDAAIFTLTDAVATLGTDPVNFSLASGKVVVQPVNKWMRWFDDTGAPTNVLRVNDNPVLQLGNTGLPFQLESASASINSDGDININSQQKIVMAPATGLIEITPGPASTELRFYDDDADFYTGLKAAGTTTADVTYSLPPADGTGGDVLSTDGLGGLSWVSVGVGSTWAKETFTLVSGDITAQKVTVANTPVVESVIFTVKGAGSLFSGGANPDYSVSGADINFLNDLATGGSALVAGDIVQVQYQY